MTADKYEILYRHIAKLPNKTDPASDIFVEALAAAMEEYAQANTAPGMRWVNSKYQLPEPGKQVFVRFWGNKLGKGHLTKGSHPYFVEEQCGTLDFEAYEWLDEQSPSPIQQEIAGKDLAIAFAKHISTIDIFRPGVKEKHSIERIYDYFIENLYDKGD